MASHIRISKRVCGLIFEAVKQCDHLLSDEFLKDCNETVQPSPSYIMEDIETELCDLGGHIARKQIRDFEINTLQYQILWSLTEHFEGGNNAHLNAFYNKYHKKYF